MPEPSAEVAARKPPPVLHPLLFALQPVLFLYAHNRGEVLLADVLRPLVVCPAVAGACLAGVWVALRRPPHRGAVMLTAAIILFFNFDSLRQTGVRAIGLPLLATWLLVVAVVLAALARLRYDAATATRFLNLAGTAAVAISLLTLMTAWLSRPAEAVVGTVGAAAESRDWIQAAKGRADLPDVYYIILDEYGRQDVLKEVFGEDDPAFLDHLRSKGFYIATKGRSNYSYTELSMASSLNMRYINDLADVVGKRSSDRRPLLHLINNSEVFQIFSSLGYTIAVSADWGPLSGRLPYRYLSHGRITPFEDMLLQATPVSSVAKIADTVGKRQHLRWLTRVAEVLAARRGRVPDLLAAIGGAHELGRPVFVYAHIMCPHSPNNYDRRGDEVEYPDDVNHAGLMWAYAEQVAFLGPRVAHLVDQIMSESKIPPVIIIQSDHGPDSQSRNWDEIAGANTWERLSNLNAIYLPGGGGALLHPTMTPVNEFRIVFNRCFGANYSLLPDVSYWAPHDAYYDFVRCDAHPEQPHDGQPNAAPWSHPIRPAGIKVRRPATPEPSTLPGSGATM